MSEEDAKAVKTLFAAFADRDFEAAAKVLDRDVEIRPAIVGGLEGLVYRGPSGMRQFWADIDATWADFRIAPEELREIEDGVLVLGRVLARGQESGVPLNQTGAWIAELREGRVVRFQSFSSRDAALEAAGLLE